MVELPNSQDFGLSALVPRYLRGYERRFGSAPRHDRSPTLHEHLRPRIGGVGGVGSPHIDESDVGGVRGQPRPFRAPVESLRKPVSPARVLNGRVSVPLTLLGYRGRNSPEHFGNAVSVKRDAGKNGNPNSGGEQSVLHRRCTGLRTRE